MLCVRCSHPLKARADRCLRCFALNPQNFEAPARALSIESDPPLVAGAPLSVASDPAPRRSVERDSFELHAQATGSRASLHSAPASSKQEAFTEPPAPRDDPAWTFVDASEPEPAITMPLPTAGRRGAATRRGEASPRTARLAQQDWLAALDAARHPLLPFEAARSAGAAPAAKAPAAPPLDALSQDPAASPPRASTAAASASPLAIARAIASPKPLDSALASARPLDSAAPIEPTRSSTSPASSAAPLDSAPGSARPLNSAAPLTSPRSSTTASAAARLLAWSIDLAVVAACAGLHVLLATRVLGVERLAPGATGSLDYWADLLLGQKLPLLWALLSCCLAVVYSAVFVALGGRTPGLALARLRLVSAHGGPLRPSEAMVRAAAAVPSAALGLSGFALAFFDPRGQTLHDKLSGALLVDESR